MKLTQEQARRLMLAAETAIGKIGELAAVAAATIRRVTAALQPLMAVVRKMLNQRRDPFWVRPVAARR